MIHLCKNLEKLVGLRTNNSFHITLMVRRTKFICRSTCRYANMPNSVNEHGLPYEQVMRITGHKNYPRYRSISKVIVTLNRC